MTGDEAYAWLTKAAANVNWDPFDVHVVASILALAIAEQDEESRPLGEGCGLTEGELTYLAKSMFAGDEAGLRARAEGAAPKPDDEEQSVRDILLMYATGDSPLEPLLARMVARRAQEPHHLWQDLGLRARTELSALMHRHFGPFARRNVNDMKWKKFFYRQVCAAEGFVLCTTPVCADCADFKACFGEESGESRLARVRNGFDLAATNSVPTLRHS